MEPVNNKELSEAEAMKLAELFLAKVEARLEPVLTRLSDLIASQAARIAELEAEKRRCVN